MAGQALFFRTCNFLSNTQSFRVLNANLLPSVRCLKQETLQKLKLLKIPEKPKKPPTPYLRFITEHCAKVAKQNPNLKQTDVIKKCAEDWKNASQELKEKYNIEYKDECVIYDQKLITFNANLTPEQKEALQTVSDQRKLDKQKRKIRKIQKETNKPKRPMGPYTLYIMEQSHIRNVSVKDLMISLKDEWAKMSEIEKAKYKDQFLKDKEEYELAMAQWEAKMLKEGKNDLVRVKSMDEPKTSRIKQLKRDGPQ